MLSIEYLLISVALAGMLALVLPLTSNAFEFSSYALDVSNASNLVNQLENCFGKLSVFSAGSNCFVEFKQKSDLIISIENNVVSVTVFNSKLNQSKSIEKSFEGGASFFYDFPAQKVQKSFSLQLIKTETEINFELLDS